MLPHSSVKNDSGFLMRFFSTIREQEGGKLHSLNSFHFNESGRLSAHFLENDSMGG